MANIETQIIDKYGPNAVKQKLLDSFEYAAMAKRAFASGMHAEDFLTANLDTRTLQHLLETGVILTS